MEQIYAKDTVPHMLSGKAIARAIRAHLLIDAALHAILLEDIIETSLTEQEIDELKNMLEKFISNTTPVLAISELPIVSNIENLMREKMSNCSDSR